MTITFQHRVSIAFEDFDTEYQCDYLEVFDGDNTDSNLIAGSECNSNPNVPQLWGHDIPSPIQSSGSSITLKFHTGSGGWTNGRGFKIITSEIKV